jgi:beta-galactosidase
MTTDCFPRIRFGADYYPEQTPEEYWETDMRLMVEAGFNVVRMAEFAWALMEPEAGCYNFAWLDRALDRLQAHGLQVILGTPTSAPPAWLIHRCPELLNVRADSIRLPYGHRHNFDPTHPDYTHNFMGFGYDQINYFDLARGLDLVSWDNYPRMQ